MHGFLMCGNNLRGSILASPYMQFECSVASSQVDARFCGYRAGGALLEIALTPVQGSTQNYSSAARYFGAVAPISGYAYLTDGEYTDDRRPKPGKIDRLTL